MSQIHCSVDLYTRLLYLQYLNTQQVHHKPTRRHWLVVVRFCVLTWFDVSVAVSTPPNFGRPASRRLRKSAIYSCWDACWSKLFHRVSAPFRQLLGFPPCRFFGSAPCRELFKLRLPWWNVMVSVKWMLQYLAMSFSAVIHDSADLSSSHSTTGSMH